ncbi:MAG: hypothetical protein R6X33_18635 [Candidatus Brocadiia bacterium]
MMWSILHDNDLLPVRATFVVATPGWKTRLGPAQAEDIQDTAEAGGRRWEGDLELDGRRTFEYTETLRERGEGLEFTLRVRALRETELAGVFLDVKVPAGDFRDGALKVTDAKGKAREAELPAPASKETAASGSIGSIEFRAPGGRRLAFSTDRARNLSVKAHPGWLMPHYRVLVPLHNGDLAAGQVVEASYGFRLSGQSDRSPARLRLDADTERYRLHGFGGNYCFWPRGRSVDYTLKHLRPAWARTQMFLMYWEPENDNADPARINWDAFENRERGMWILQTEMNAARKMAERGIPFIISCWQVPDWMRVPESESEARRRPIDPDKWPEVVESICAYLLYLKENYGAEPEMFSFNEPQLGRIPDPEHHRDFSKLLGRRMKELGLKTRILAGDVSNPAGDKIDYPKPLLNDAEGRGYVGALAFHSWGGATPETYRAWSELARQHDLPLFCTEVGWYALAHKSRASRTALYALEEMKVYQDLLLHARPQVLFEWEYGGSYPLLLEDDGELEPTARYWMMDQFANRTPRHAVALGTRSDNDDVLFTAFRGAGENGRTVYALHVANLGADRPAVIEALPGGVTEIEASYISVADPRKPTPENVSASGGTLEMRLPALSLTTLRWED